MYTKFILPAGLEPGTDELVGNTNHSATRTLQLVKEEYLIIILGSKFSLVLKKKKIYIYCGYISKVPWWGSPNENLYVFMENWGTLSQNYCQILLLIKTSGSSSNQSSSYILFVWVEVLWPSQPTGVMLSVVNLLTLFLGRLSPLNQYLCTYLISNWQLPF